MHDDNFTKGKRGEFRGDFTRDTFDPFRRFSRVLMQQGRVALDADHNEDDSIQQYFLRSLAMDIMGPHAASISGGFELKTDADKRSLIIDTGHYYVDGILCENDRLDLDIFQQPDWPLTPAELEAGLEAGENYLAFLDVWERHISYVEDDYIREKALAGPDTSSRARIVWQVKLLAHREFMSEDGESFNPDRFKTQHDRFLQALVVAGESKTGTGRMQARAKKKQDDDNDPCLTPPESRYRGPENQLYRVEIHRSSADESGPTFTWSRENSSVNYPVLGIAGKEIHLEHLGRDCRYGLSPNDWVELIDDACTLRNRAESLLQIESIDSENMIVTLKSAPSTTTGTNPDNHPYLRRWDQKSGDSNGMPVTREGDWIDLEDGIQVRFSPALIVDENGDESESEEFFQTGDYWLIPARVATGDVEWPGPVDDPEYLTPQGIEHHYAPLANFNVDDNGEISNVDDLRRKLKKSWS